MTARVGVIGIGEIGQVHLDALSRIEGVDVVGTLDPRGGSHASAGDLVDAGADTLVVATPTPTHVDICRDILGASRRPRRVLVEKPLATDMDDVDALVRDAASTDCDLQVLYHVAYAPEVTWGLAVCDAVRSVEGEIVEVESYFSDLVRSDELERFREVLVTSWVDVGINALSVLHEFVALDGLALEDADREANFYRAAMSFAGGTGQLTTAWRGDEKWTALRFESGAALRLDHQRVSGRLTGTDNDTSFAAVPGAARLVSHYTPMFTELLVDGRRRFATADDVALHRLLLEA